jgi:hypothetical protein
MYRSSIAVVVPVTFTVGVSARTVPSGVNRDAGVPITASVMRHVSCCCCCNQKQAVICLFTVLSSPSIAASQRKKLQLMNVSAKNCVDAKSVVVPVSVHSLSSRAVSLHSGHPVRCRCTGVVSHFVLVPWYRLGSSISRHSCRDVVWTPPFHVTGLTIRFDLTGSELSCLESRLSNQA